MQVSGGHLRQPVQTLATSSQSLLMPESLVVAIPYCWGETGLFADDPAKKLSQPFVAGILKEFIRGVLLQIHVHQNVRAPEILADIFRFNHIFTLNTARIIGKRRFFITLVREIYTKDYTHFCQALFWRKNPTDLMPA